MLLYIYNTPKPVVSEVISKNVWLIGDSQIREMSSALNFINSTIFVICGSFVILM